MQKQCLGQLPIAVSRIGLGTVKFGRNQGVKYSTTFSLPSDQEIESLLAVSTELGINLLDTAPAYGSSEERLGKLLEHKRKEWIITTKVGEEFIDGKSYFDFSPATVCDSIHRSLKRLRTDYLDIVLVHSNGDDVRIIEEDNIFSTLAGLKKDGKIRAFGMSTKTVAGGLLTIDHADIAMVTFNLEYTDEREVITHAEKRQKGIFIKKALGSGYLDAELALPFIFAEAGVTSMIVGTINPLHLRRNVEIVNALTV